MNAKPETNEFERLLGEFQVAQAQRPAALEEFTKLLEDFGTLPRRERRRPKTLMEVAGFPHHERPYSNILAFLLNPEEDHGMGDLVLRSLLQAAAEHDLEKSLAPSRITGRVKVEREVPTEEGKWVDIVVETDSFVLGIENKIEAPINNPLDQYWEHLKKRARSTDPGQNEKACRAVLLSLHDEKPSREFKPVTYDKLFSSLRKNLGEALSSATPKYLFYLLDFIETLNNLKHGVIMDHNMVEFFLKHEEPIKRFLISAQQLREELNRRTKQMKDVKPPKDTHMQWKGCSEGDFGACAWFDIELRAGLHFGAQVWLDLKKWEIYTYASYDKDGEQHKDWVERHFKTKGFPLNRWRKEDWGNDRGDVWVYADFPYEKTEETVRNKFQELIEQLEPRLPLGRKPG
jgi:hypothetical protein